MNFKKANIVEFQGKPKSRQSRHSNARAAKSRQREQPDSNSRQLGRLHSDAIATRSSAYDSGVAHGQIGEEDRAILAFSQVVSQSSSTRGVIKEEKSAAPSIE
jgi:hypothetical protein